MTVVQELTGLDTAVDRGTERLLSLQHPEGWWKGELESNATMIAQHLFLLHFLGLRDADTAAAADVLARRIPRVDTRELQRRVRLHGHGQLRGAVEPDRPGPIGAAARE